jgi:hypothetical protein
LFLIILFGDPIQRFLNGNKIGVLEEKKMIRGLGRALKEMKNAPRTKERKKGSIKFWVGVVLTLAGLVLLVEGIPDYTLSFYEIEIGNYFEPEENAKRDCQIWSTMNLFVSPVVILIGIILMIKGEIQKSKEREEESEVE